MKPSVLASAALAAVAGCSLIDHSGTATKTEHVIVDRPAIVGFFPTVTDRQIEEDGGVASALEHWEWALENARRCFGPNGVHVQAVLADEILIESDGRTIEVAPNLGPLTNIGYYLVAPGRASQLVTAGAGPSSLLYFLPKAASEYFAVPECAPEPPE